VTEVLFVCTGNLCRSPSAAWFMAQRLVERGPEGVRVDSAGTMGSTMDVPPQLVREGELFGIDLSTHLSRTMTTKMIQEADLVVGLARQHVREIVLADTPSFTKAFTLREVVRRGSERGKRQPEQPISEWLEGVSLGRRHLDLIGDSPIDDTPDPMGGTAEDYHQMLEEVRALVRQLHSLVWPRFR
jgi:protein-tyrosine phosphatase